MIVLVSQNAKGTSCFLEFLAYSVARLSILKIHEVSLVRRAQETRPPVIEIVAKLRSTHKFKLPSFTGKSFYTMHVNYKTDNMN